MPTDALPPAERARLVLALRFAADYLAMGRTNLAYGTLPDGIHERLRRAAMAECDAQEARHAA